MVRLFFFICVFVILLLFYLHLLETICFTWNGVVWLQSLHSFFFSEPLFHHPLKNLNFPIRLSPKTLAWTFMFEFWVWSFSAAIFFQRPFPFNCFSTPKPRSTLLPTFWALMGWWLQWPLFSIGLGGPPRRRQPKFFCIYPIHLMMFCFVLFFFLGRMMMLMRC